MPRGRLESPWSVFTNVRDERRFSRAMLLMFSTTRRVGNTSRVSSDWYVVLPRYSALADSLLVVDLCADEIPSCRRFAKVRLTLSLSHIVPSRLHTSPQLPSLRDSPSSRSEPDWTFLAGWVDRIGTTPLSTSVLSLVPPGLYVICSSSVM